MFFSFNRSPWYVLVMLVQKVLPKQAGSLNLISVTSYCAVWLVKQVPRVPEDIFFLWILMVRGKATSMRRKVPREKNTLWSQELRVSFPCNFRMIYLIKPVWSCCACLFSLKLTAEIWSYATLHLRCMKKELLRKESAIKNCHKFFSKKIHFKFQVNEKDRSQLRSTHSVYFWKSIG